MYPLHFANLFPPFPRNNKVFVAMSFADRFRLRWEDVIRPAIAKVVDGNGHPLEAERVDVRTVGDSILTEILQGISNARCIVADISTMHEYDGTAFRNANVMYEIGLAHALRLPEEVLIFRSDNDRLLFDLQNVRVNRYDPDNDADASRKALTKAIVESLREIAIRKRLYVDRAVRALDRVAADLIIGASGGDGTLPQGHASNFGELVGQSQRTASIMRMLDLGILEAQGFKVTPELLNSEMKDIAYTYQLTAFGHAVAMGISDQVVANAPGVLDFVKREFPDVVNHPEFQRRYQAGSDNAN